MAIAMSADDFAPDGALVDAIRHALADLAQPPAALGVALSGGIDSAMLAVHAAALARQRGVALHCLHIHHGLQAHADAWQRHAHDLALRLGVACHSLRVQVTGAAGDGVEAAARKARYAGLAALARQAGVTHILLGHHCDDQAETVLLRLLRGAGPEGLAAMAPRMQRDGLCYLRPWLDVERAALVPVAQAFSRLTGWHPVMDPSNTDDRYTRSALRERLVPALDARWPAWRATLARHARLGAQTREVLDEVAGQDLQALNPSASGDSFSLSLWRALSPARQALVLRHWLALNGVPMPGERRLADIMRQLRGLHALGHDRQMRVRHAGVWITCVRGRVALQRQDDTGDTGRHRD